MYHRYNQKDFINVVDNTRTHRAFLVPSRNYISCIGDSVPYTVSTTPLKTLIFLFDPNTLIAATNLLECLDVMSQDAILWKMFASRKYQALKNKVVSTIQTKYPKDQAKFISKVCRDHTRGLRKTLHFGAWAKPHKNNNGHVYFYGIPSYIHVKIQHRLKYFSLDSSFYYL